VVGREDVARHLAIAVIEHRGERGRLARAGGADHETKAALLHDHFLQHLGQPEGVERRDAARYVAHHYGGGAFLTESADAEGAHAFQRVGGIQLHLLLVLLDLALVQDFVEELLYRVGGHHRLVHRHRDALQLDIDGRTDRDEDVRRILMGHYLEQPFHGRHGSPQNRYLPLV